MLVCVSFCASLHTRPRVQRAPGIPCSLYYRGTAFVQTSGASRREIADTYSVVIVRESGRSSIPEASVIESKSRGVLDTRFRGYDSIVWGRTIPVIVRPMTGSAKQSISQRNGRMD